MQDLLTNINSMTETINSFRMPIILLLAAFFGYRIAWKVLMSYDTKGLWEDIIWLFVSVGAIMILPELLRIMVEYLS